jgi:hypothetical protein
MSSARASNRTVARFGPTHPIAHAAAPVPTSCLGNNNSDRDVVKDATPGRPREAAVPIESCIEARHEHDALAVDLAVATLPWRRRTHVTPRSTPLTPDPQPHTPRAKPLSLATSTTRSQSISPLQPCLGRRRALATPRVTRPRAPTCPLRSRVIPNHTHHEPSLSLAKHGALAVDLTVAALPRVGAGRTPRSLTCRQIHSAHA